LSTSINPIEATTAVTTATHAMMESCRFPRIEPGECLCNLTEEIHAEHDGGLQETRLRRHQRFNPITCNRELM
jgi:hypothetical protein